MAPSHTAHNANEPLEAEEQEEEAAMLDPAEADEEIFSDPDHPMDSDPEDLDLEPQDPDQEIQLQNDSIAHFDHHTDSIFCIAQHPLKPSIVATGSGDDTSYVFSTALPNPVLPPSYESNPSPTPTPRASLSPLAEISGHTDSINALTFTLPTGAYLLTAGLDGRLRAHTTANDTYSFLAESQEVPEINFLIPCPHPSYPNTVALGASDGSVWVYSVESTADGASPLQVLQAYYLHTESCTAGAWTPDGKLLATVSEEGSFYVWDVFGEAAAAGVPGSQSQAIVGLTAEDQRFAVEGGLYSVAIAPSGAFAAVGGANGLIRIIGLPILRDPSEPQISSVATTKSQRGNSGAKSRPGGGSKKPAAAPSTDSSATGGGQAGQILASLQAQTDGIETLSFSPAPLTLLAAGSVDGSIALFDHAHRFAVRRHIRDAHEAFAVVQVEFVREVGSWALVSAGMDGVVRRWDVRGGTAVGVGGGMVGEWRGHRGEGEGGGVLGFVMGGGRVVTAGDDGMSLVFES